MDLLRILLFVWGVVFFACGFGLFHFAFVVRKMFDYPRSFGPGVLCILLGTVSFGLSIEAFMYFYLFKSGTYVFY